MVNVEAIAEELDIRIKEVERQGFKSQLRKAYEEDADALDGFKYDYALLDFQYQVFTDGLIKELDLMVLREEITEDEREEITRLADLD